MGEVKFDQVEVPAEARLAGSPDTWAGLERAILRATPLLSAYKAGACGAVFDISVQYSRSRIAFGVPIGRFQRVQDHIIEVCNRMDSARWAAYEALWKLDTGRDAAVSVHLSKAVASESYYHGCNFAHEAHGGIGTSMEYGLTLHTEMSRSAVSLPRQPAVSPSTHGQGPASPGICRFGRRRICTPCCVAKLREPERFNLSLTYGLSNGRKELPARCAPEPLPISAPT